jgi:hypothetical protein
MAVQTSTVNIGNAPRSGQGFMGENDRIFWQAFAVAGKAISL